jgi:penicillin-insensitive murein DD-endopeptidase
MSRLVRVLPFLRGQLPLIGLLALMASMPALAQDVTPPGYKLPPLTAITPATPAKQLFGRKTTPADLDLNSIGFYAKGCLSNGVQLPATGPTWQVMRPSRNRAWGNAVMIRFIQKLASQAPNLAGWPGILIGDIAQPRGGPMITGHASHQVGLDADIWLTPMPDHVLSKQERETMSAVMMVRPDRLDVSRAWTPGQMAMIRAAAQDSQVERVFANAAIKKALCRDAGADRAWLSKVRPIYGHDYHFHVRLLCPSNSPTCKPQTPPPAGDGCGKELDYWFSDAVLHPRPPATPPPPPRQMVLAELPPACRQVLAAP